MGLAAFLQRSTTYVLRQALSFEVGTHGSIQPSQSRSWGPGSRCFQVGSPVDSGDLNSGLQGFAASTFSAESSPQLYNSLFKVYKAIFILFIQNRTSPESCIFLTPKRNPVVSRNRFPHFSISFSPSLYNVRRRNYQLTVSTDSTVVIARCYVLCTRHIEFAFSQAGRHSGYSHSLAIMNNAAVNTHPQVQTQTHFQTQTQEQNCWVT